MSFNEWLDNQYFSNELAELLYAEWEEYLKKMGWAEVE